MVEILTWCFHFQGENGEAGNPGTPGDPGTGVSFFFSVSVCPRPCCYNNLSSKSSCVCVFPYYQNYDYV